MYQKIDKMIKDLELRGRSKSTIKNMVCIIKCFSRFYNQPPEMLGEQHIINYLKYCLVNYHFYRLQNFLAKQKAGQESPFIVEN